MSEENVEVVRQPIALRDQSHRSLDQRLALRFPGLLALSGRAVWRLSPRSRIRQAIINRGVRLSFDAVNRRDYAAGFALYHQDGETIYPPGFAEVGVGNSTRGRIERIEMQRRWDDVWGEYRNELAEIIDFGDRMLLLGRLTGSGAGSGAPFEREVGYLVTVNAGQATRERIFLNHGEALEAAGLSE